METTRAIWKLPFHKVFLISEQELLKVDLYEMIDPNWSPSLAKDRQATLLCVQEAHTLRSVPTILPRATTCKLRGLCQLPNHVEP